MNQLKRIMVVGVGRWGRLHCEKVVGSNWSRLVGVVDKNPSVAAEVGRTFDVAYTTELRDAPVADFAIVAVDRMSLAEVLAQVISRGMPFLAEKPISACESELRNLKHLSDSRKLIDQVGYQLRFDPRLERFTRSQELRFNRTENFSSLWTMLCDCAVHDIDLALYLAGPIKGLELVSIEKNCLSVVALTDVGKRVHWQWSLDNSVIRTVEDNEGLVDLTGPSVDLLAEQWTAAGRRLRGEHTHSAGLRDAIAVAAILTEIAHRAGLV